ncbi:MAG: hypothetical protein K2N87_07520 [Eubacterium sp.]|nr:hypothetical protein [Eubacterium sp.]
MIFEMRKLVRQMHVRGALLIVLALSAAWGIVGVGANRSLTKTGEYLKGKAAFANDRKKYESVRGDITEEKLNEALWDIQLCPDESSAYVKALDEYPGIGNLLDQAYAAQDGHFTLFELESADDFYARRKPQIRQRISINGQHFSDREMEDIFAWAEKVQTPFQNEMSDPWRNFYTSFQFAVLINLLTAIIYGASLFSYEKSVRMHLIAGSMGRGTVGRMMAGKAQALAVFTGVQYLASMAVLCVIYFGSCAPIAWDSQIQSLYFTSILPLSYRDVFILGMVSGLLAVFAAAFFTALLDAWLQKPVPALALGVAVTFVPLLLRNFTMLPNSVMRLVQVLPVNAALLEGAANSLFLYPFPGNGIPGIYAVPAMSAVLAVGLAGAAVYLAQKGIWKDEGKKVQRHTNRRARYRRNIV